MPTPFGTPRVYEKLGIRSVIHGSGTTTRYGGSRMRPETMEAMREAAQVHVNIDELNVAAGAAVARMLEAPAGLVTGGSTAGLVLQAAACMTGDDPAKIARLPDTTGLRNEFVIQRAHRFPYDQAYRVPGGVLVEIGLGRRTAAHELEAVLGDRTAGVICLVSALAFHGITDQMPRRVWIAIGPKDWKPRIDYPPLRIVHFADKYLREDIETHEIEGVAVPIFGVAKTIADAFRHRRSVGIDVAISALKEALRQRKATPSEISAWAIKGGVWNVLRPYLEAFTADA